MKRQKAISTIREILPASEAAVFIHSCPYIMLQSVANYSDIVALRLDELCNGDEALIEKMKGIYDHLDKTLFHSTERVNRVKSVSGEKSLLELLTDGETHLKIYPSVDFNIHRSWCR